MSAEGRNPNEQFRRGPVSELPSHGVCIVGMACRFPGGGNSPEAFWNNLLQGKDMRTTTPTQRWNYHHANQLQSLPRGCKNSLQYGYFVEGLELFDAACFGIKPTEAEVLDPQQRMLLEVTYEALGRAGYTKDSVQGTNTGVFVAVTNSDRRAMDEREDLETVTATSFRSSGGATSVCSGRLSYVFGLMGPSFSVDTACSSSLVAFHCAVNALMMGDCDMAIVGGVNAMISAHTTAMYAATGMLSPDCRCKAFDAHANGYARGEGCGVLVLKRLADAHQESRPILAAVRASAVMHHGNSDNLVQSQMRLLQTALRKGGIQGAQVDYLEAHGIGIKVADSSEIAASAAVLLEGRPFYRPLVVGALKPAIGHLESASGVAALIKAVLVLQHRQAPPNMGGGRMQSAIMQAVLGRPIEFPTAASLLTTDDGSRLIAAVNCFGVSGTLSHVLLESVPARRQIMGGSLFASPLSTVPLVRQAYPWPGYNDQHELLQVTRQLGDGSFAFAAEIETRIRAVLTVTLHGMPAVPAALLLELACNAALAMQGTNAVELRNLHLTPLCRMPVNQPAIQTSDPMLAAAAAAVAAEEEPPLQTVLCRVWQKASKLQVHTAEGPADDVLRSARLERTFCVAVADYVPLGLNSAGALLDVAALQARCTVNLAPPVFYRQLEASGLLYQGTMRCIHRISRSSSEMEAYAGMRVPNTDVVASFNLHPCLLEAAIHLAYAAAWSHVPLSVAYTPVAISRLVYYRVQSLQQRIHLVAGVTSLHAHSRIRAVQDGDLIVDCVIASEGGEILAEIHGATLRPLAPGEAPGAAETGCALPYFASSGQPREQAGNMYSPYGSGTHQPSGGGSFHNSGAQPTSAPTMAFASGSSGGGFASAGGSIGSGQVVQPATHDAQNLQGGSEAEDPFRFSTRRSRGSSDHGGPAGGRRGAMDGSDGGRLSGASSSAADREADEAAAARVLGQGANGVPLDGSFHSLRRPSTAGATIARFFSNSFSIKRDSQRAPTQAGLVMPRKAMDRPGAGGEPSPRSVVDYGRRTSPNEPSSTTPRGGDQDSGDQHVTGLIPIFNQGPQSNEGPDTAGGMGPQGGLPALPSGSSGGGSGRSYSMPPNARPASMTKLGRPDAGPQLQQDAPGLVPQYGNDRNSASTLDRLRNLIMGFDDEGDMVARRNAVLRGGVPQSPSAGQQQAQLLRALDVTQDDQELKALLAQQAGRGGPGSALPVRPSTAPSTPQHHHGPPVQLPASAGSTPVRPKLQWSQLDAVPEVGESSMLAQPASPPQRHSDGSPKAVEAGHSHPIDIGGGDGGAQRAMRGVQGLAATAAAAADALHPQPPPPVGGLPPMPRGQSDSGSVQDWPTRPSSRNSSYDAPRSGGGGAAAGLGPAGLARSSVPMPDPRFLAEPPRPSTADIQEWAARPPSRSSIEHRIPPPALAADGAGMNLAAPAVPPPPVQWAGPMPRLPNPPRRVVFLFDGSFNNLHKASIDWYRRDEVFREALAACSACLQGVLPVELPQLLYGGAEDPAAALHANLAVAHVAAFATGYASARSLIAGGIVPDVVIGYGLGEYLAACMAGVIPLRDALLLLVSRARLIESLPRSGTMVAVKSSPSAVAAAMEELGESIGGAVSVAAVNSPQEVVLSGLRIAMDKLLSTMNAPSENLEEGDTGAAGRPLHSPLMEALSRPLRLHLEGMKFGPAQLPFISTVTGCFAGSDVAAREHWVRQMVAPIQFLAAMRTVQRMGVGLLLQVGPGSRLLQHAQACVGASDAPSCVMLPTLGGGGGSFDAAMAAIQQSLSSSQ